MFARSPLAAWAHIVGDQLAMLLAHWGDLLGATSNVDTADLQSTLNDIRYDIGLISLLADLTRSVLGALKLLGISCRDRASLSIMTLYGGPINYLFLQILAFFGILFW